jgi:hypothetical protein
MNGQRLHPGTLDIISRHRYMPINGEISTRMSDDTQANSEWDLVHFTLDRSGP